MKTVGQVIRLWFHCLVRFHRPFVAEDSDDHTWRGCYDCDYEP